MNAPSNHFKLGLFVILVIGAAILVAIAGGWLASALFRPS